MPGPEDTRNLQTFFTDADGNVRRRLVDPAEAERIAAEGGEVFALDHEGRQQFAEEARREGVRESLQELPGGSAPLAGLSSALDHLLFGAPSLALRETDPQAALFTDVAREDSPVTDIAVGAASEVIPAILTGGGSSLGTAALVTPGGMAAALGNFAERELADALVSRGLSRGLARAVGVVGGAGVDGLASGVLQTITDHNITGSPLDAEQFAANGLFGLATGLVTGVPGAAVHGLSGIGRARAIENAAEASGVVSRSLDDTSPIDSRMGLPTEGPARAPTGVVTRISSTLSGVPEDAIAVHAANARHAADQPGFSRAMRETDVVTGSAFDGTDNVMRDGATDSRARLSRISEHLAGETGDAAALVMTDGRRHIADVLNRQNTNPDIAHVALDADRELLSGLRRMLPESIGASPIEVMTSADRVLDYISENRLRDRLQSVNGRLAFDRIHDGLVSALPESLGEAGARLASMHAAVADLRGADYAGRQFTRRVNGGTRFNVNKMEESFRGSDFAVRPRNDSYALMSNMFAARHRVLDQLDALGVDTTAARQQLDAAAGHMHRARNWGEVMEAAKHSRVKEAEGSGVGAVASISSRLVGGVIGNFVGGPVGAVLGFLGGAAWTAGTHPAGILTRFGGFVQGVVDTRTGITQGVNRLRSALESGARAATRAAPPLVMSLKGKSGEEQYRAVVENLRMIAANPDMLVSRVEKVSGAFEDFSPNYADTVANMTVAGVQHLVSNLPPADQPNPFSHLMNFKPSRVEMEMFVRRYHAIEDPLVILDLAAANRLTAEHVEAVAAVYPQLLVAIQAEVAQMIGDLTTLPSYSQRVQLGTMLRIPTDPTLEPSFIFALQQSYAQTQQQAQVQGGPRRTAVHQSVATDTYSSSQSLELSLS